MAYHTEQILEALTHVTEPDLKKDLVTLNLVSNVKIDGNNVSLDVQISNPAMHSKKRMEEAITFNIQRLVSKDK